MGVLGSVVEVPDEVTDEKKVGPPCSKNPNQLDKTVGVLGSVVEVPDEVTNEKKV